MPIDDRSPNRNYKLPNAGNFLADDVQRLRDALTAIDADIFARYTKTETDQKLADLINGAPGALDTLNELAAAMGNDPNFATTITNALAGKPGFADVWTRTQADARYVQGVTQTENVFTGTGSQTTFTLTQTPPTRESLLVTVDGVVQPVSAYTLSGSALILSEAPASGAAIRVLMLGVAGPVQSASTLSFTQAGAAAVARTAEAKLRDFVNILDFIPVAEHAGIKAKTSTYDCTTALQNALTQAGRVYMPTGKYRVTQTITVSVGAGFAERPELIGAGGNTSNTQIDFVPAVAGSALFNHFHSATYRGIYFTGPGEATGTGEKCFDFGNVGTQRHTIIEECMFRYWNSAALYFSGQWQLTIDNCRFLDCGNSASPSVLTGGIVFDQTVVTGWSTSGMVISNCYFSGCSYGYYAESAWNLLFINPVFEYCTYPFLRNAGGSVHVIISPWLESNANAPVTTGPVVVLGGRGVDWSGNSTTSASVHVDSSGVSIYRSSTPVATLGSSGNLVFANGYGIDFSAVAGAGASNSVLTDYETGSWTPVITDGTNNSVTTATIATYTKIGNVVSIRAAILNVNTTGMTAGSQIRISGLPYATGGAVNTWQHVPITVADVTSAEGTIVGQLRNSSTQLLLNNQTTSGLSSAVVSQISNGVGDFWLNFSYVA